MADFTVTINSSDNKVIVNEQTNSLVVISPTANNVTIVSDGIQGPAGTTDHGSLTGLSDDDHTQYLTTGRADTWLATKTTSNLTEGSNLYFTDERAQDAIGAALTDSSTIDFTYNDGSNTISASVTQSGIDHGSISGLSDDDHTQYHNDSRANTWLATKSTSDLSEGSNLYYTDERVDDRVNALLQAGTNVSLVYNDLANTLTINATGGGSSSDSFVTIQTDSGTNPVADSSTDTLTLTTDDTLAYSFVGDSSTDTVELNISDASTSVRGLVSTSNQTFKGIKTISNNSIDEPAFDEGFVNELFVQNTSNQSATIRAGSSSVINSNNFDLDVLAGFGSYAEQNGTGTIGNVVANVSESILTDNGNITTSIGSFSSVSNESSSGSINVASSFVSKVNNISTGTIVNGYALFSDQNDATNKYGIHIDIAGSKNVFHEVQIRAESQVKFYDSDSSNYVGIKAPSTAAADRLATLQDASGTIAYLDDITSALLSGSTYILTRANSDVSGYEYMDLLTDYAAGALATVSQTVTTSATLLEEFITQTDHPNVTILSAGIFSCYFTTQKSSGSNNYHCFFELYKRSSGGTETLLMTSDSSTSTALNTDVQQICTGNLVTNTSLLVTDRLVVKIYAQMTSSSATITLKYDDTTSARFTLPSSPIGYVPENVANKSTDGTLSTNSTTLYPSESAVKTYADTKMAIAGGTFTGTIIPSVVTLTDAATIAVNATLGNQFTCTITASRTLGNPTGAINGQLMLFVIRQNGTGGYTLSFDTKYRFGDEIGTPAIATGADKTTYIGVRYHGTDDKFDVISFASNY